MTEPVVVGWDIGGAHVKACLMQAGRVHDVAQWACPLWQGMEHLERALGAALERWPQAEAARHAVTMTGEMVDLFTDREDGVQRIAALLAARLPRAAALRFFAGDAGWCVPADVAREWAHVASANWLASAHHAASCIAEHDGLLVDIGSTTTDLIALRRGRVLTASRTDAQRLATGELVYHGVVRTPLCALTRRIAWHGRDLNVMNEFFATTADLYRLTGELDPAHDLHPPADNAGKDLPSTRRRLARMIGLDAREGSTADWLAFAHAWRAAQVDELSTQMRRVMAMHHLSADAVVVSAGCGDFLVGDMMNSAGARGECRSYGSLLQAAAAPSVAAWAQVCAPSVAVAALLAREPS